MSRAHTNQRGTGHAQYPPSMMLGLLIYCYATGTFASRRIETQTYENVAVRFLTGDTHPDHDSICKFRRENKDLLSDAFHQVLELAAYQEKLAARQAKEQTTGKKPTGKQLYGLRKETVEPVFGIIKQAIGFRRFLLRGKDKLGIEWTLMSTSYNLKRLFNLGMKLPIASDGV